MNRQTRRYRKFRQKDRATRAADNSSYFCQSKVDYANRADTLANYKDWWRRYGKYLKEEIAKIDLKEQLDDLRIARSETG